MKIIKETSLANFEAWSDAEKVLERIVNNDLDEQLEAILEEEYPDGIDETSLNDILRFESDWCYEMVGLQTEDSIREMIDELEQDIEDLKEELDEEIENSETSEEIEDLLADYTNRISEKEEELRNLKNELDELW